ncbi:MAG: TolC family protein [Peptococcia bacterium]
MRKKTTLSLLLIFVLSLCTYVPSAIAEVYALTINKAIELALLHSPEVKQAENKVDLAYRTEIVKKQEKESAYTRVVGTPFFSEALEADYKMKKKIWQYAQDDLSDAQVALEKTKEKVKYTAENQYLTILNLQNQLAVLQDSLAFQTKLVKIENIKYKLGLSTQLELQQARERVEATQNSLQEVKDTLTTLYWSFNRLIGQEINIPFRLAPVAFSPVKYNVNKEEGLEQAKEASLALEQFNRLMEDKKEDKKDLKPGSSDQCLLLETEMRQIELNIDALNFGIEAGMKQAWDKVELAQKKLLEAKNKYGVQKLNCTYQEQQYSVGLIPQIALDTGAMELKQAEINYEKAVYDYYLATRELSLAQQGIMLEK